MDLKKEFSLTSVSGRITRVEADPLGPLAGFVDPLNHRATWKGRGFNQIWRPFHGTQDRFPELNETLEQLEFDEVPGDIPNRGFLQADINLHGLRYLRQIQDANVKGPNGELAGIHIEPGLSANIPATTNPQDSATVARMANIPHGTSLVVQGSALPLLFGPPPFALASIAPFTIAPPHTPVHFPETNRGALCSFRTPTFDIPNVTQAMVNNPNIVLSDGVQGKKHSFNDDSGSPPRSLSRHPRPAAELRTSRFLQVSAAGPNAQTAQMDAIFLDRNNSRGGWIDHAPAPILTDSAAEF